MLIKLLNQVNSQIQKLDINKNEPIMLAQIDHVRPDFRQYLYQNAPNKKVADLAAHAIARGILIQIKAIPDLVKTMVSQLESQSSSPALRCSIAGVLVYLVQPRDLIPDNDPGGYGFVDDNAIVRAGFIEYMNFISSAKDKIKAEKERIQFVARIVPKEIIQPLQLAINSMAMTLQLMSMLDIFTLDLTLQQMINNPLQLPAIQRPNNFNPSPGPDLGLGHWSNGAYFEGNNVVMPGGASLIDGELFIPD